MAKLIFSATLLKFMFFIMNKLRLLLVLFLIFVSMKSYTQVNDAGLWTSVNIDKKIGYGFTAGLCQELRFNENISELGTAFTEISLDHKILKGFSGGISYRFIQNRRVNDEYSIRHRLNLDIAYRLKWKKFTATIRERYQNQVKDVESSSVGFSPESYLRSKFTVKYNTGKKYNPWIASELFLQLNNPAGNEIDNIRYSLGFDYKFNKKNSVANGGSSRLRASKAVSVA